MKALVLRLSTVAFMLASVSAHAADQVKIVALGDDGMRGKGVSESDALPAQLQRALRARGNDVVVLNAGVDDDTTDGLLARLDSAVPDGTHIVVLSIGAHDRVLGKSDAYIRANNLEILRRLKERNIHVHPVSALQRGLVDRPELHVEAVRGPAATDWHLNAEGYAIVTARILPAVEALVKKIAAPAR